MTASRRLKPMRYVDTRPQCCTQQKCATSCALLGFAGSLTEALCPISCRPLLSLAARNEWPCAVTQLYNDGEITMEGESTLDNSGTVLTIIADLESLYATRRGACTHHAVQCHHTIHSNTLVNAMIAMMHNDLLQCGTARQRGGDHHARRVHAGQQRTGLTIIADLASLPATRHSS